MPAEPTVLVEIVNDDALSFSADLLVLKYARALYGVDAAVFSRLTPRQRQSPLPAVGHAVFHDTRAVLGARNVMFLGVPSLNEFNYAQIREFGRKLCATVKDSDLRVEHLAVTVHGPGYGLDENEAFESVLGGIIDAIGNSDFPDQVRLITFVEHDLQRCKRLAATLRRLLPAGRIELGKAGPFNNLESEARTTLRTAGSASAAKPRVFVAMPFLDDMADTYHYGIQGAVHAAGMLCERADLATFTGDVTEWVKHRIETAKLVVADLSSANPNVYLEVGYAWGRKVPTVLLCKDANELKFDVKGQRCVVYKSITDLEAKLLHELKGLFGQ